MINIGILVIVLAGFTAASGGDRSQPGFASPAAIVADCEPSLPQPSAPPRPGNGPVAV